MKATNKVLLADATHQDKIISTGFAIFRPDPKQLDPSYLRWYVLSDAFQAAKDRLCSGATQKAITNANLEALTIPLPSLRDQRHIVDILDRVDALRANRRSAIVNLDVLTQSIFLDMFGDSVTNPKGFPVVGIDEVCELIVDCVNRTAPLSPVPTPYKMIRTTNVRRGNVDLETVRYVSESTFFRWNRRATPRRGDVLLTREAPVGAAGILRADDTVFLGQRLMLYRPDPSLMTSEYLSFLFQARFLQRQFSRAGSGSTVKHLPLPVCRHLKVLKPPIDLQRLFEARVVRANAIRSRSSASLTKLDALFESLRHRAFRGEL